MKQHKKASILSEYTFKYSQGLLMLDVSDIHILMVVTETGSINKAAEKLFISQPTLSKRISRLEQVLNAKLFHRHSSGMQPTEIANYLIGNGKKIQSQLDAMCRHVELMSNLEGGKLSIGVSTIIEQILFPDVLLDFVKETQKVEISFQVEKPEKLPQALIDGEIDIAIGPFNIEELPADLIITKVKEAPVVFVVRPEHPVLQEASPISLDKLTAYPGIGPPMNNHMVGMLAQHGISDLLRITCDNYEMSKSLVKTSNYFTGGPKQLFDKEIEVGELTVVALDKSIQWQAYCIMRPESLHAPTVKKFLEIAKRYAN